jgi:hypothetical protein
MNEDVVSSFVTSPIGSAGERRERIPTEFTVQSVANPLVPCPPTTTARVASSGVTSKSVN